MKVLYLGMNDDIMSPLLLYPDLDTLYVLDILYALYHPGLDQLKKLKNSKTQKPKNPKTIFQRI